MMYALILMCLMMTVPSVLAGDTGCLKKLVSGSSCTEYVADNTCEAGQHFDFSTGACVDACPNRIYGTTYQKYIGMDVDCPTAASNYFDDLDTCKSWCEDNTGSCLSFTYNSETKLCRLLTCDALGDVISTFLEFEGPVDVPTDLGPCVVHFVRNCPITA